KKAAEIAQKRDGFKAKADASSDPAEIAALNLKVEKQQAKYDKVKAEAKASYGVLKDLVKVSFFGQVGGCLGETSSLALLIGGVYLLIRRTISFHIPAAVLISAFIFAELFYVMNPEKYSMPLLQLFGGGMLLCAFFIATDPVTAPLSVKGMWIFGAGVGVLIMLIRFLGEYPEGVMFAVLIMNAVTPLIDRACKLVPAGGKPNVN
ncbi:MAG: RnfABCDGE type electron transport complex subunit D, partial [Planctomycetota bacterium]